MNDAQLSALLAELLALPNETDCVEFKENVTDPEMIGQRISGLANSAALCDRAAGYQVWGVEDGTHRVTGTNFKPQKAKVKGEALINWLLRLLTPQVAFHFHEWKHEGHAMVVLEVPAASHQPVRFSGQEYVRISSHTKPLKDHPQREKLLWTVFDKVPFEKGIAKTDVTADEVLSLLDFVGCFGLLKVPLPSDRKGTLARLADENLIASKPGGRFDVTNLGAVLFAKDLGRFDRLSRKALRIIKYKDGSPPLLLNSRVRVFRGDDRQPAIRPTLPAPSAGVTENHKDAGRTETEREWRDEPSHRGYAVAFEAAVAFVNSQLPQNEPIGQAFRSEVRLYPEVAIRELVANALIHQDFTVTGAGPMVEIFKGRMEITNPGEPLVDPQRFIDTPPRSRNEDLAALMRRMKICEEGGTGIDKVIEAVELFQLPAPDFAAITTMQPGFTKATLFAYRKLTDMDKVDRIRACYQHASLRRMSGGRMTNPSLRQRFGIESGNASQASRLIKEALVAKVIRLYDPAVRLRDRSYVPFWA